MKIAQVEVNEYSNLPEVEKLVAKGKDRNEVVGYVEPAGPGAKWILFFTNKGDAIFYTNRGPKGGVLSKPIRVKARIFGNKK